VCGRRQIAAQQQPAQFGTQSSSSRGDQQPAPNCHAP
jgi:hypothetical protein